MRLLHSLRRVGTYPKRAGLQSRSRKSRSHRSKLLEVERLEDRTLLSVIITSTNNSGQGYTALDFNQSGGYIPPDSNGAAGPTNYVDTVNQEIAIYSPKATGASNVKTDLPSFFSSLPLQSNSIFSDPAVIYDDNMPGLTPTTGRFIVGDLNIDSVSGAGVFDLAVSKSASPTTVTSADWTFYQISTESGLSPDYPGNLGFNHDALVFTLNEFGTGTAHGRVTGVNATDLVNGVSQAQLHFFENNFSSDFSLRPAVMHDAAAGAPMWLVSETGDGSHINVYKISNVLSTFSAPAPTQLAVNSYTNIATFPPLQPDGTVVTINIDSRVLKVAEANNTLVATHPVSVSGTQDAAQWYVIDVSSGTPVLSQQGDVSLGNNTYAYYPGIDINASGDIGMSFMDSGTATGKFMSMYVTARTPTDPSGQMETPVLVPAGTGQTNYHDFAGSQQRAGDLSGINIDPSDGSFCAVNEFANQEAGANWGTAVANFTFAAAPAFTATLVANTLQIQGTGGGAHALIRLKAGDSTTLEVLNNGTLVGSFSVASVHNITANLTGGSNQLTVDDSNGDPVPAGGLSYDGGPSNTLTVNAAADTTNRTITLDSTTPSGDTPFGTITGFAGVISYEYADTSGATLTTGTGADTINVTSTGTATSLADSAAATINIGNGNLSALAGAVTVNGSGGTTTVNVKDQSDSSVATYTLTASTVSRTGFAGLTSSSIASLTLNGGSAADTYKIQGTASGTATTVNAGAANDTFNVGSATNSLDPILGALTLNGGGGTANKMNVNDQGSSAAHTYNLTATTLTRTGAALITFGAVATTVVNGGSGGNSFVVALPVPTTSVTLNGGSGTNTLTGPNATNNWSITGTNAGTLDTKVKFTKMQNLVGGTGLDTFKFSINGKVTSISGGGAPAGQGDWLDYSSFTSTHPVTVNLATGSATNVNSGAVGAISGIENVIGGAGADTLTGDSKGNILIEHGGAGTINGGTGRSLLISGTGPATVNGGSGGDILIGGKTSYDTSSTGHLNLMIILAEWRSADAYSTRTDEITDGAIPGHTGVKLAVGSTVTLNSSAVAEHLNASPSTTDLDWFFASSVLQYSTPELGEIVNNDPN